jgi:hypothetical protein
MHDFDWDQLLQYVGMRKVVPIVGRDLLVVPGKDGPELVDENLGGRLAAELDLPGDAGTRWTIRRAAFEFLKNRGSRPRIYSKLYKIVASQVVPVPAALADVAAIPGFRTFVSTTCDGLLPRALHAARPGERVLEVGYAPNDIKDLPLPRAREGATVVYHLFGQANPSPTYAVTEEDTLEFLHCLQSESRRPKYLFDCLRENHVLMMGCSMPDWLSRFFVRTVRDQRLKDEAETVQFVVDDRVRMDPDLVSFLRHHDVQVWDGGSCADFVTEFRARWDKTAAEFAPAPSTADAVKPPGFVFLSYAREDIDAARRLHEALQSRGVRTWFDTRDIAPGSAWEQEIFEGIRTCSAFVAVMSHTTESRPEAFFRREWKAAAERMSGMSDTMPFLWQVVVDPGVGEIRTAPREFAARQRIVLPGGEATESFLGQVEQAIR